MASDKDVLRAIDNADSLRVRSTLATWMRKNHDAFLERLTGRVADWGVLCGLFTDAGLTNRYGHPPKPETARKMWLRIRREVAADRARRLQKRQTAASTQPVQSVPVQSVPSASVAPPRKGSSDDVLRVMSEMSARGNRLTKPLE